MIPWCVINVIIIKTLHFLAVLIIGVGICIIHIQTVNSAAVSLEVDDVIIRRVCTYVLIMTAESVSVIFINASVTSTVIHNILFPNLFYLWL